jgi:hypothetical protein
MNVVHKDYKMKHELNSKLELSPGVDKETPSFVAKLCAMLGDARAKEHIYWSARGDSIVISDPGQFSRRVLPM